MPAQARNARPSRSHEWVRFAKKRDRESLAAVAGIFFADCSTQRQGRASPFAQGTGAKRILLQNVAICGGTPSSSIVPPPSFHPPSKISSPLIMNPLDGNNYRRDIVYSNIIASCGDS